MADKQAPRDLQAGTQDPPGEGSPLLGHHCAVRQCVAQGSSGNHPQLLPARREGGLAQVIGVEDLGSGMARLVAIPSPAPIPISRGWAMTQYLLASDVLLRARGVRWSRWSSSSITLLLPGDPALAFLGEGNINDKVAYEAMRKELGLDQPVPVQYGMWLSRAVQGDLGRSVRTQEPVLQALGARLPVTLQLAGMALLIALLIAIPSGSSPPPGPTPRPDTVGTVFAISGVAHAAVLAWDHADLPLRRHGCAGCRLRASSRPRRTSSPASVHDHALVRPGHGL